MQLRLFVIIAEIASVASVNAYLGITQTKWYPESTVNATTFPVTDTRASCVLDLSMVNVSAAAVSVTVSGIWPGTVPASARQVTNPASHLMGSTSTNCVLGTVSASVGSASARRQRKDNIQENFVKTVQPAQENVTS